jgi:putative addiction module killer protein
LSQFDILEYIDARGRNLFRAWKADLDRSVQQKVQARVRRMSLGNFGKDRHLGGGMHEAKLDFGPGYRIYYGIYEGKLILLLCGGDKSSQSKDITAAHAFWRAYPGRGKQ